MTNEEKRASEYADIVIGMQFHLTHERARRVFEQAIREAKIEAFEGAIQIAAIGCVEWQRGLFHEEDDAIDAGHQIAHRIRALRDSLLETVPS